MSEPDWKARALVAENHEAYLRHVLEQIKICASDPKKVLSGAAVFFVKKYAADTLDYLNMEPGTWREAPVYDDKECFVLDGAKVPRWWWRFPVVIRYYLVMWRVRGWI